MFDGKSNLNKNGRMPNFIGPDFELEFAEVETGKSPAAPKRQALLRVGKYTHPKYGDVEIRLSDLKAMVKNHEKKVRKVDSALDYGHNSGGEAAAWISSLAVDGNTLFGEFEWVEDGKKAVEAKKWKYLSADFTLDYEDNESRKKFGPTLLGAGLTNRPFVKGMEAVQLSEGVSGMMTLEQALAEIERLKGELAKVQPQAQQMPQMQQQLGQMQKQFSDAETALKEATDKLAVFEKAESERKANEAKAAKEKQFSDLLAAGKACEAQRELFFAENFDAVKFAEAFVPAASHTERKSVEGNENEKKEQSAAQKIVQFAEKLVKDGKALNQGAAISMVLSDPEHKALVEEYNKG